MVGPEGTQAVVVEGGVGSSGPAGGSGGRQWQGRGRIGGGSGGESGLLRRGDRAETGEIM